MIEWKNYKKSDSETYSLSKFSQEFRLIVTDGLHVAECRLELHHSKGYVWRNGRGIFDNVTHYAKINFPKDGGIK